MFKARICSHTQRSVNMDYSIFYIEDGELLEEYLKTDCIRIFNIEKALKHIFEKTKCFIPFNKFDVEEQIVGIKFTQFEKVLTKFYTDNPPVSY